MADIVNLLKGLVCLALPPVLVYVVLMTTYDLLLGMLAFCTACEINNRFLFDLLKVSSGSSFFSASSTRAIFPSSLTRVFKFIMVVLMLLFVLLTYLKKIGPYGAVMLMPKVSDVFDYIYYIVTGLVFIGVVPQYEVNHLIYHTYGIIPWEYVNTICCALLGVANMAYGSYLQLGDNRYHVHDMILYFIFFFMAVEIYLDQGGFESLLFLRAHHLLVCLIFLLARFVHNHFNLAVGFNGNNIFTQNF